MEDYTKCELSRAVAGSPRLLNTCLLLLYTTHMVAIVDCTHVHHVVHYKIIRTYHILLLVDYTNVGSATPSFKDLIILNKRTQPTKQQMFW